MKKMIIADDEQSALDLLNKILDWESLGIEICGRAHDGREALLMIEREQPEILLTDIRMPELDGMELLDRIHEENLGIETVIISAYDDFEYAQKALAYGIAGYILKPVNEIKLEDMIGKILKRIEEREKQNSSMALSNTIARNTILCKLLFQSNETAHLIEMLNRLNCRFPDSGYYLAVIQVDFESYRAITDIELTGIYGFTRRIQSIYRELESKGCLIFDRTTDEWIVLAPTMEKQSSRSDEIPRLISRISDEPGISCSIEFSKTYRGLENLPNAYSEASEGLNEALPPGTDISDSALQKSPLVKKAVAFLEEKFMEDLNLEEICSNSSVSKTYFCGLFKKEMGVSIWDYLTECRIREAEKLIRENELRNYEIAFKIGYENPGYFSKMFKRVSGQTPSQYRMNLNP